MVKFSDDDDLEVDEGRRVVLSRELKICTLLKRLGKVSAVEAVCGLNKLLAKYPLEAKYPSNRRERDDGDRHLHPTPPANPAEAADDAW